MALFLAASVHAGGYGGGYGSVPVLASGGGCGGLRAPLLASAPIFLAGGGGGGGCGGGGCGGAGPLAVVSRHRINYVPTPSIGHFLGRPQKIFVDAPMTPVQMVVRSYSSPVQLAHRHISARGTFRATQSQDVIIYFNQLYISLLYKANLFLGTFRASAYCDQAKWVFWNSLVELP